MIGLREHRREKIVAQRNIIIILVGKCLCHIRTCVCGKEIALLTNTHGACDFASCQSSLFS